MHANPNLGPGAWRGGMSPAAASAMHRPDLWWCMQRRPSTTGKIGAKHAPGSPNGAAYELLHRSLQEIGEAVGKQWEQLADGSWQLSLMRMGAGHSQVRLPVSAWFLAAQQIHARFLAWHPCP